MDNTNNIQEFANVQNTKQIDDSLENLSSYSLQDFEKCIKKPIIVYAKQILRDFKVQSLEGIVNGKKGDFLIIGAKGEKYIIRKDIFFETYEIIKK